MISFKQFLAEAFDNPFNYVPDGKHSYSFKTDGGERYSVYIGQEKSSIGGGNIYSIVFQYLDYHRSNITKRQSSKFGGSQFALSGKNKDSFRILATVKKIVFDYFKSRSLVPGDRIEFDTFDPATAKLYTKFAEQLAKLTKTELSMRSKYGGTEFILHK